MSQNYLIKNGTIITMNHQRETFNGDIFIKNDKIEYVGQDFTKYYEAQNQTQENFDIIDATNCIIIPGLIQAHTHLCQTLFRGDADDMSLLDWLQKKIWPMEFHHNTESIKSSAQVGLLEMTLSGTTSILDMGTVQHTHKIFEVAEQSQMRYFGGKCLMDLKGSSGPLYESLDDSLKETEKLISSWHHKNGLLNYVLCPRFAVSCTEEMLIACKDIQKDKDLIIHTHASENIDEVQMIVDKTGMRNIEYFNHLGILNNKTVIAHGIHLDQNEKKQIRDTQTHIVHCPSSNLKLASGIASIHEYVENNMNISLGADGAPCNNSMDPFIEMRLCALLQKPLFGPEALRAERALELATLGGAKALGMQDQIGSIEKNKKADIVIVDKEHPSVSTVIDPYSAIVYSCLGRDVRDVFINGKLIVKNKTHQVFDQKKVLEKAKIEHLKLLDRI